MGFSSIRICLTSSLPPPEMKNSLPLLFLTFSAFELTAATPPKPNIIFVLCDDLGFGDTGVTFQNARAAKQDRSIPSFATPQIDRFAAEGMVLRNHYCAAPVCAPSRASFLLGQTQGHANVRDNQFDKELANNHTVASVLKNAGYATAAIGKWGLQGGGEKKKKGGSAHEVDDSTPSNWVSYPTKRGFDFYYGYVRHVDGHFHYPKEDKRQIWENDHEVSADLGLCYTADLFTARAKKWIADHVTKEPKQPFFLYLAYDTPHAKLQLPPCAYPSGGGLRGGLQWQGKPGKMINTAHGEMDGWMDPAIANATWDHDRNPETPEIPWPDVQKRYVTDVRRIDSALGDLTQLLKDLNIDDNTLVVFSSDNGPSQESYLKEPYHPTFFSGFGPFDGIKRDTLEGGVREPTFARWPGHVQAGQVDHTPSGLWDWLATFIDAAGLPAPATTDGVSLLPILTGKGARPPGTLYIEYSTGSKTPNYQEFQANRRDRIRSQMQTVLVDGYIGLRYNIKSSQDDFEIYDVEKDPNQSHNLASDPSLASVQAKMKARVLQVRRPETSAVRPYDETPVPGAEIGGSLSSGKLDVALYEGTWPWVPNFRTLQASSHSVVENINASVCATKGGAAFTGWFHATSEGNYTFHVTSDGGSALFLHDARVIDDDFARQGAEASASIRLAPGWHPLRVYYRRGQGAKSLAVEFTDPSGKRQRLEGEAIARSEARPN